MEHVAEKVGMRGYKNQSVRFSDPLTLTLTLTRRERGLLRHPPAGEREKTNVEPIK
jgi:hypothetical protein